MKSETIQTILDFWYAPEASKKWFNSTPAFDLQIKQRFESLWQQASDGQLSHWQETPNGCLALCIVLDQFPLNMFRCTQQSFQTEAQAIGVSNHAISKSFDDEINVNRVSFLYMPLMHSEKISDQNLSVTSFEKRGLNKVVRIAKHHRDLIVEFGRFPHRNDILGRESTSDEVDYLNSKRAFKG